jgi:hypothetical protein
VLREPQHKSLVFTSAGDRSNVQRWLKGQRQFDLWVTYYGDRPGTLGDIADFYHMRRGSKFQNLRFAYGACRELFVQYDAVMVMDDDVLLNATQINRLFAIREQYDLWVLQPAYSLRGKISWDITRVRPTCKIRYTNFVEMTCPLFRRDKLDAFMSVYDPVLVGYGMDWWFLHTMGHDLRGRVAVVDEITCVNPFDRTKGHRREIDVLQPISERLAIWQQTKTKYGIPGEAQGTVEYARIAKPYLHQLRSVCAYCAILMYVTLSTIAGRILRRCGVWLSRRVSQDDTTRTTQHPASARQARGKGKISRLLWRG